MSYKQVLCVLLSLSAALNTFAYDFMVDGLAYNVLSTDDKTVELTNTGNPTNNYSGLTQADIPSAVTNKDITYTVTRIGDYALYYANLWQGGLRSITLPSTIREIGGHAFTGLNNLTEFVVDAENPTYKTIDGVLFTTDEKELVAYPVGKEDLYYNIPQGTTTIGGWAFASCCHLQKLIIPNTVMNIGEEAFYLQNSLTTIYCYSEQPPTLGNTVFSATGTQNVFVQQQSVDAYKAADQWKDHNIQNGTIALDETSADTQTQLRSLEGEYVYAQLNRSFVADGAWYTLCLPFALTADEVAESFGQCELMKLDHSQKQSEDLLYIHFNTATAVEAGTPYLFRPASTINSLVFKGVAINMQAATVLAPADGLVSMTGTYSPRQVPDGKWYLGPDNTLYQPQGTVKTNGFRAYFTLAPSLGNKVRARVVMNGQISTDFDLITTDSATARKVIEDGQVYIVRNGVKYNLQGQKIAQ